MSKNILVIAAHPDDEILGCGGTMAVHATNGDRVTILILGEGITSRKGDEQATGKLEELSQHARDAQIIVGATQLYFGNFPDNMFDSVPLLTIVQKIEEVAEICKPEIIYTHHHGDVNVDHRMTSDAVQAAFRPMEHTTVNAVYAFEIASSSEWNFRNTTAFRPNVFVALTDQSLAKKLEAMSAYSGELRDFPHPRSLPYLTAQATLRGSQVGFPKAEAFELVYHRIA